MLKKNVYIMYPAGYSGAYLRWALTISDGDLFETTVKDPVNKDPSGKFGGVGSAHQYLRIPTHQLLTEHLHWVLYNRPTEKLVYVINSHDLNTMKAIESICRYDPDPVFIVIHNGDDYDTKAYTAINCTIKWPLWLEWRRHQQGILWPELDIATIANNQEFRNHIAENFSLFRQQRVLDITEIEDHIRIARYTDWYKFRNERNPQEVNEDNYLIRTRRIHDDVYFLNCRDIVSEKLPAILDEMNEKFAYSDKFSSDYIRDFQPGYVKSQSILQWFDSIANWRTTGVLNEFLLSHSMIEGLVIKEILESGKFPADWKNMSTVEINDAHRSL